MSGFFVAKPVSAAHTATVSVDVSRIKGGSVNTLYTFTITKNSGDDIKYVRIETSNFTVNSELSTVQCPQGLGVWSLSIVGNQVNCSKDDLDGLPITSSATVSIRATAPTPPADLNSQWSVRTFDVNSGTQTSNPATLIDVTPPTIGSAVTLDVDGNGKIDRAVVTFSENIDDSTFSAGNFSIGGIQASSILVTGTDDDNQITLDFSTQIDGTGVKTLLYTQGTGADLVGNLLADASSIVSTDQAAPVLLSAKTTATNKIEVTFSEDLNGSTVTNNDFAVVGYTLTDPNAPELNGVVTLTTSSNFGTGDTPAVSYNTTVSNGVKDLHENQAIAVSSSIPSDGVAPIISSSRTLTTTTVQVTFSEPMSAVDKADFTVGGSTPSDATFTPTETTAVLTLGTPIGTGDTPVVRTVASPANTKDNASTPNTISGTLTSTPIDGISPTVSISSLTTSPTKVSPISVTATFSETVTGFELTDTTVTNGVASNLVGGGSTYTFDLTPTTDGPVTVKILENTALDVASNQNSVSNTFSIVYDSVPPTVDLTKDHDDLIVRDANTVVVTATFNETMFSAPTINIDVGSGVDADILSAVMTGSGTTWTYSWNVPSSHDGLATLTVAGVDLAGNAYQESDSIVFTIDNTAPTASVSTQVTTPTNDTTPNVGVTVQAGENWKIKNGADIVASGTGSGLEQIVTLPELSDGTYNLTLEATDIAGNTTPVALNQFIVDSTNPVAVLSAPVADSVSTSADVGYTSTVTDATAVTCEYKIDGGIYASTNCTSGTITGLVDGRHTLYIKATDSAGNYGEAIASFVVNTNANLSVGGVGSDFSSIQDAVTKATAGDTISISAGIYAEDVVIAKALILTGTGSPTVTSFTLNTGANLSGSSGITSSSIAVNSGAKIQDGIFLVAAGGTVNVGAGTYNVVETPGITIDKALTINGAGASTTIITGQNKNASVVNGSDVLFNITSDNVTIKNLTIDLGNDDSDYDVGIFTANSGGIDSLTVQNNILQFAAFGNPTGEQLIHLGGGSGTTISGNSMETASGNSVLYVGDGANTSLTIENNTVAPVNDADGGGTFFNQMAPVTNSTISGNNFTDTGIAVYLGSGTSNTDTISVTNNTFTSNNGHAAGYGAIAITSEVDGVNTQNITITGNTFSGSQVAAAITIFDSANAAIPNVIGNTIVINSNKFNDDNFGGISVGTGVSGTVNAKNNWWGNISGPTHTSNPTGTGDIVSNGVDFRPWYLTSGLTSLDESSPTVVISSSVGAKTNVSPVTVSIVFSESVTGFTADDITVTNGTKGVWNGSGDSYSIEITPNPNSTFTVNVAASTAQDLSGNYNTVSNTLSIDYDSTVPTLSSVSISSNNTNSALAKVGDVVTLSFTSSETIQTPNVTIAGNSGSGLISLSNTGNNWTSTYTMREADTEGAVAFTIAFSDLAGNPGTPVIAVSDSSSVTFDKTLPVITISSPIASAKVNGTVKPVFTDSETIPSAECSINNSVWVSCTTDTTTLSSITGFNALTDGSFMLYIKDADASGNVGTAEVLLDKDTTGPSVVSKTPSENAVGVSPATDITIVFGEAVNIDGTNVTITGNPAKTVTFDSGTKTAIINPTSDLLNNTTYTITISGVTDTVGNSLPSTSWMFTTSASYSITLYTGWNLISLPIVPTNTAISSVLGTLNDVAKIDVIYKYNPLASSVDNSWEVYRPGDSVHSNFSSMTAGEGYWVSYLSGAQGTLAGTGNLFQAGNSTPPQKTLSAGWNLIGYYQLENVTNVTSTKALSSVAGQWTQLRTYNNVDKQFQAVGTGIGDYMKPGEGYWIFMKSSSYAPYLYGPGDKD